MMFNAGHSLSIKSDGELFREKNTNGERQVYLPFESEYSIFVKNKTNYRSSVKIKLDGKFVHPHNNTFVIEPNSSLNLERFVNDGNLGKGEKFKFVNVIGSGETPGESENGLVEVIIQRETTLSILEGVRKIYKTDSSGGFWNVTKKAHELDLKEIMLFFEKNNGDKNRTAVDLLLKYKGNVNQQPITSIKKSINPVYFSNTLSSEDSNCCYSRSIDCLNTNFTVDNALGFMDMCFDRNIEGVTVGGGESNQRFNIVEDFDVEQKEIILKLRIKPLLGQPVSVGNCPGCGGKKVQENNVGIKVICPVCKGTGSF